MKNKYGTPLMRSLEATASGRHIFGSRYQNGSRRNVGWLWGAWSEFLKGVVGLVSVWYIAIVCMFLGSIEFLGESNYCFSSIILGGGCLYVE